MKPMMLSLIGILNAASIFAQTPDSLWSRTYGGDLGEGCYKIIQLADSGFVLAGWTQSFGAGGSDFWLMRTDQNGDSLSSRTYGTENNETCCSAVQTRDGGFAFAGRTDFYDAERNVHPGDFYLVRTDENGDSLWSRTYGYDKDETCYAMVQTADGGFALAGSAGTYNDEIGQFSYDVWLIRADENGDSLWSRAFGGEGNERCNALIQTADGGFALAGSTESFGIGGSDFWLLKTDENGDSLWSRTYGTIFMDENKQNDDCYAIIQMSDSGFALAGRTTGQGVGSSWWLVRTDESGDSLWSRHFGARERHDHGIVWDECHSLYQSKDGGLILAGYSNSYGDWAGSMRMVKTDADGDSLWSRILDGPGYEGCASVVPTYDYGYALAGYTAPSDLSQNTSFWLVKAGYSPRPPTRFRLLEPADGDTAGDGAIQFVWRNSTDINPQDTVSFRIWFSTAEDSTSLAVTDTSFVADLDTLGLSLYDLQQVIWWVDAVSGADTVECTRRFRFTIRTTQSIESRDYSPANFGLRSIYPNPFNSQINFNFVVPAASRVTLSVYDVTGRLLATPVSYYQTAGRHSVEFSAGNLQSGIYIYCLKANEFSAYGKMALIR